MRAERKAREQGTRVAGKMKTVTVKWKGGEKKVKVSDLDEAPWEVLNDPELYEKLFENDTPYKVYYRGKEVIPPGVPTF